MYPRCVQIFNVIIIVVIIIVNAGAIAYGSVALIFKHKFLFHSRRCIAAVSLFFPYSERNRFAPNPN